MASINFYQELLKLEQSLNSLAFGYTKNDQEANQLTQDTMIRAIHLKRQFQQSNHFRYWVFGLMRNLIQQKQLTQ